MGTRVVIVFLMIVGGFLIAPSFANAQSSYSSGTYGSCQYNTCGISLSSSSTVTLNVTPGSSTACTTASDLVQVETSSSAGYTLTMTDGDTATDMNNGAGGSIPTISGTAASPVTLTANTWGYRVDDVTGFGAGPTSANSNTGIPSVHFAGVPASNGTAATLATSAVAASPAVTTTVWYGLCADTNAATGTYTDSVVYTAVVN